MASWFTPRGPYSRKSRWGFQSANQITTFFRTLIGIFEVKHSGETGEFVTREVAKASGTYVYNSGLTRWDLVGGVGPLPAIGTRTGAGQCKLTFTSSMGAASKYDVFVTCKTKSGTEVLCWSWTGKTATEITIVMREQGAPGALYDGDFSICIHKEP